LEKIKDVTGGAYHSAVLMNTGRILTFGAGQLGQLGRQISQMTSHGGDASGLPVDPQPAVASIPTLSKEMPIIERIGAGFYNTFAISSEGKLFCTGENQNQQCGTGHNNLHIFTHVKEVDDHEVEQVDGGYCHTLVKTLAGKVLSLGCGDDGQRGDSREGEDPDRPIMTPIDLPVAAVRIAAGANHSVVLGDDGSVFTFGANDVGQCGVPSDALISESENGDKDEGGGPVLSPRKVELPLEAGKVVHVSAGYAHTVLTTSSGRVFVFGQNDNGQLGFGADCLERGEEPQVETSPVEVKPQI
jgi:regulator of chromosome condensation